MLFDLLELDGEQLLDLPLERAAAAAAGGTSTPRAGGVAVSPQFDDGEALLAAAREQGLEGVVAKRLQSRYQPGRRSPDWRKVKLRGEQELVIVGYTRGKGRRGSSLGALVLGGARGRRPPLGGQCRHRLHRRRGRAARRRCSARWPETSLRSTETPRMPRVAKSDIVWVEPKLVADVRFAEWTSEGRLRAPVYVGLRDDKAADDVRRERRRCPPSIRRGRRELTLSNLDKPFWPDEGITKGDLIAYYRDVAPVLVPHLRGRPFTMKRYPDGWQGKHFFQKDTPKHAPPWLRTARFPATTRDGETTRDRLRADRGRARAAVGREHGLHRHERLVVARRQARSAGLGHVRPRPRRRRRLSARSSRWRCSSSRRSTCSSSRASRRRAARVASTCSCRSRGGTPTRRRASSPRSSPVRSPARTPGLVTTEWARQKRRGVLVDANQNGAARTTATVYSVRPRAGAPVSAPLRWEEVGPDLDLASFTMETVLDRVARDGDLFAGALAGRQSLTRASARVALSPAVLPTHHPPPTQGRGCSGSGYGGRGGRECHGSAPRSCRSLHTPVARVCPRGDPARGGCQESSRRG